MRTIAVVLLGVFLLAPAGCGAGGAPLVNFPPTLTSVSPSIGGLGGGTLITLRGSSFAALSSVTVGGLPCLGVAVDPLGASLTCTTPPGSAGPKNVTVSTVTGSATLPGAFTYAPVSKPTPARESALDVLVEDADGLIVGVWFDVLEGARVAPAADAHPEACLTADGVCEVGGLVFHLDAAHAALTWYADLPDLLLDEAPLGVLLDERLQDAVGLRVLEH